MDIIERSSAMFDKLVIGILNNQSKMPCLTTEKRLYYINKCIEKYDNVEAVSFEGLLVDFAKRMNAKYVVRGLRALSDFEIEMQMSAMNKRMYPEVETVFLMTDTKYSFLSSSMVRDVGRFGGDFSGLVPDEIYEELSERLAQTN